MSSTGNTPLRPPLRPPSEPVPKGTGLGKAIPAPPSDWRDPAIFGALDARVAAEKRQDKEAQTSGMKRNPRAAVRAGYGGPGSRRPTPARPKRSERPAPEAFQLGRKIATEAAQRIRAELGDRLSRDELVRVAATFRSAVVPRRKPGRQPSTRVTAAYVDWKAGMTPRAICEKHIPGWLKHNRYRRNGELKGLMDAIRNRSRRERSKRGE